ncbi:hypothetical protein GUITHDRAFT_139723 [Guillardia theta CCMP2712]|uniref:Nucleotide-diphospho-sugar transferase domain-containing protein n=1 Tax=Guillardia theta (strain CCMP2712) TaxID=905079 RepID=L1J7G5_GUITC|nr:hypothetical protein GUITHDRAFT_139723 [Guillardia theta CCMP2712]EKX44483.1 hypothetical protein GUITHDRAFT_139723 [Guillardia theta CCMP2712]|eukprot:XP_005831463.1 hypothetical protein GUITHDRAFT_139723 [Guillardia theta CCMP2712]
MSRRGRAAVPLLLLLLMCYFVPCSTSKEQERDQAAQSSRLLRESLRAEAEGRLNDAIALAAKMPQDVFAVFRQGKLMMKKGDFRAAHAAFSAVEQVQEMKASIAYCLKALQVSPLDLRANSILKRILRAPGPFPLEVQEVQRQSQNAILQSHLRGGFVHQHERMQSKVTDISYNGKQVRLVSSANSLYFQCLANLVGSIQLREPNLNITIYDMGFDELESMVVSDWKNVQLVRFPFESYPPHVRNLRNYAWKPLVYREALMRDSMILYQDAGQELWQPVGLIEDIIARDGYFFVMQGEKTLPEKIHPASMQFLGFEANDLRGKDMCAGGIQGYMNTSRAVQEVLGSTIKCALDEDCIAPKKADQSNHRFDQAIFSMFMSRHLYRLRSVDFTITVDNLPRCHCSWIFRAYLETARLKEADVFDVRDGFGHFYPLLFSRRCGSNQSYFPIFRHM